MIDADRNLTSHPTVAKCVLWSSRIIAAGLAGLVLFIIAGHGGLPRIDEMTGQETLMMTAMLTGTAGLILLWRWPAIGGGIGIASMATFYALNWAASGRLPGGWVFPMFLVASGLGIVAAVLCRSSHSGDADSTS